VGANGDAGHWLSTQLRYPGLSLLIAKLAGGCGCVLRADVVQQLEQLGFLQISLQQPLDLGFSSAIKFVMPKPGPGYRTTE
jgi:hypothetical protein